MSYIYNNNNRVRYDTVSKYKAESIAVMLRGVGWQCLAFHVPWARYCTNDYGHDTVPIIMGTILYR